jgi:hypothetical protein
MQDMENFLQNPEGEEGEEPQRLISIQSQPSFQNLANVNYSSNYRMQHHFDNKTNKQSPHEQKLELMKSIKNLNLRSPRIIQRKIFRRKRRKKVSDLHLQPIAIKCFEKPSQKAQKGGSGPKLEESGNKTAREI